VSVLLRRVEVIGGPWPERIGCKGQIVEPSTRSDFMRYPFVGRSNSEVIILLDDDPLLAPGVRPRDGWSCAIDRSAIRYLPTPADDPNAATTPLEGD
jgi:hypothetical protein